MGHCSHTSNSSPSSGIKRDLGLIRLRRRQGSGETQFAIEQPLLDLAVASAKAGLRKILKMLDAL